MASCNLPRSSPTAVEQQIAAVQLAHNAIEGQCTNNLGRELPRERRLGFSAIAVGLEHQLLSSQRKSFVTTRLRWG